MDKTDAEIIKAVLGGAMEQFEILIAKYQPKVFGTVRRYARKESEIEEIVQEIFIKAFQKIASYRGEAPFEHWLMRMAVRTCYDFLRKHQRNRETAFSEIGDQDFNVEELFASEEVSPEKAGAARQLVQELLNRLPPAARLVITLLEIEEKSVKEIAALTGWSVPLVKVRAFRARAEMRKLLAKLDKDKYL